jgi:UDP-glucose 4-epimerase
LTVLVTGGAGFIGSHLAEALVARGEDVVVLDDLSSGKRENLPEGIDLVEGDVREPQDELFAGVKPTVCYHLAAQIDVRVSVARPDHDAHINVLGTVNMLQAALEHGTQVVFSSTGGAIYGECEEPAAEDGGLEPLSPYGASKLAAEEYLWMYGRLHGTRHVALRFGNVYGPRQDPHGEAGVVAIFFGRLADGEPPRIFGDGRQTRDYVYVGDVVDATLAAAGTDGGVFNVGTGRETSVLELAEACMRVSGIELQPVFEPGRLGELQRSVLDTRRTAEVLGTCAATSLDEGLAATWRSVEGASAHGAN